jgi:hypothetical protein
MAPTENRTHNFPAFSAVSQPSAPPRGPRLTPSRVKFKVCMIMRKDKLDWIVQFYHGGVLTARDQQTPRLSVCDNGRNLWSYSLITFPFSLFCASSSNEVNIYLFIYYTVVYVSDSGTSNLGSLTVWTYPSCLIKNKHSTFRRQDWYVFSCQKSVWVRLVSCYQPLGLEELRKDTKNSE